MQPKTSRPSWGFGIEPRLSLTVSPPPSSPSILGRSRFVAFLTHDSVRYPVGMALPVRGRRFLLIRSGEQRLLIPSERVVRILSSLRVNPLPGAAPEVMGLAQVEGEPLAVIDLARMIGGVPLAGTWVRTALELRVGPEDREEVIGLGVDKVVKLVGVEAVSTADVCTQGFFQASTIVEGETALIVDLEKLGGAGG